MQLRKRRAVTKWRLKQITKNRASGALSQTGPNVDSITKNALNGILSEAKNNTHITNDIASSIVQELVALQMAHDALAVLQTEARERVITFLLARFASLDENVP